MMGVSGVWAAVAVVLLTIFGCRGQSSEQAEASTYGDVKNCVLDAVRTCKERCRYRIPVNKQAAIDRCFARFDPFSKYADCLSGYGITDGSSCFTTAKDSADHTSQQTQQQPSAGSTGPIFAVIGQYRDFLVCQADCMATYQQTPCDYGCPQANDNTQEALRVCSQEGQTKEANEGLIPLSCMVRARASRRQK